MRISYWSSDVCSSYLVRVVLHARTDDRGGRQLWPVAGDLARQHPRVQRQRTVPRSIFVSVAYWSFRESAPRRVRDRRRCVLLAVLGAVPVADRAAPRYLAHLSHQDIGCASCSESVCHYVYISFVAVSFINNTIYFFFFFF